MGWKAYQPSFQYGRAAQPRGIVRDRVKTALLVIDVQNTYLEVPEEPDEATHWSLFFERMNQTITPNTRASGTGVRAGIEMIHARIACL